MGMNKVRNGTIGMHKSINEKGITVEAHETPIPPQSIPKPNRPPDVFRRATAGATNPLCCCDPNGIHAVARTNTSPRTAITAIRHKQGAGYHDRQYGMDGIGKWWFNGGLMGFNGI